MRKQYEMTGDEEILFLYSKVEARVIEKEGFLNNPHIDDSTHAIADELKNSKANLKLLETEIIKRGLYVAN